MQGFESPFHSSTAISYSCTPIWPWDKVFGQANKELKQLSSKWVENTLTKGQVFLSSKWLITKLNDQVATSSCWRNLGRTNSLGKKAVPNAPTRQICQMLNLYWKARSGGLSATRRNLDPFSEHLSVKWTFRREFFHPTNPWMVSPDRSMKPFVPNKILWKHTVSQVSQRGGLGFVCFIWMWNIPKKHNSYTELVRIPCEQFQKPIGKSLIMVS